MLTSCYFSNRCHLATRLEEGLILCSPVRVTFGLSSLVAEALRKAVILLQGSPLCELAIGFPGDSRASM